MSTGRPVIFIVDDDDSVRRALGRVMASAGFEVQSFVSADSFLTSVPLPTKGCVVTDMTMPGLSGLELKRHLNSRRAEIPVIFLTAYDSPELRAAAHEAGAAGYFRKPVDTQALLDAVQWALDVPSPAPAA